MPMEISGSTALVTGGSRRIGRSISMALARSGADILVHYHQSGSDARDLVREIRAMGRRAWAVGRDLADPEGVESWFDAQAAEHGGIDILVNSASEYRRDRYTDMELGSLHRSVDLHGGSPLAMIRSLNRQGRSGSVVNILDARIDDYDPTHASYHVGKQILSLLTRDLARELAPLTRVNAVAPGVILPPSNLDDDDRIRWRDRMDRSYPLGGRGRPEDVAGAVLYLIGADFVTGQIIFVDGGRHLNGRSDGY